MLMLFLILLLMLLVAVGGRSYHRYGAIGFAPAAMVLILLLVLLLTGNLNFYIEAGATSLHVADDPPPSVDIVTAAGDGDPLGVSTVETGGR